MQKQNNQISIIIPTMQKDIDVLNMLVAELVEDNSVGEILIIDNSLNGYSYPSEKVRVHIPKKNLYVNPSWNYGIKNVKNDIIGILNDDLLIPKSLCSQVLEFILKKENCGLIGLDSSKLISTKKEDFDTYPSDEVLDFQVIDDTYCTAYWGAAIFGHKSSFVLLPNRLKIWCGDNFLLLKNLQKNKECYQIKNCVIKHLGSLTVKSVNKISKGILEADICYYADHFDKKYKKHSMYKKPIKRFLEKYFSINCK